MGINQWGGNMHSMRHLTCEVPPVGPVRIPEFEEQQRDRRDPSERKTAKIDALIARVHEAIDHLKEFRTALISAAVTGKIDVREAALRRGTEGR